VREQLRIGEYSTPQEFHKDLKLIFQNAKEYTPSQRSPIHGMTIRLSALCEEKMKFILSHRRGNVKGKGSGIKRASPVSKPKTPKKRSTGKRNGNLRIISSPDIDEQAGASTSGVKVEPGTSNGNVRASVRKRARISSGEDTSSSAKSNITKESEKDEKKNFDYKALCESETEDEDEYRPPTATSNVSYGTEATTTNDHADSDTEIEEEKAETDATEIDDEELDGEEGKDSPVTAGKRKRSAKRSSGGRSRKKRASRKNGRVKKIKKESESAGTESECNYSASTTVTESLSPLMSGENEDEEEEVCSDETEEGRRPRRLAAKNNKLVRSHQSAARPARRAASNRRYAYNDDDASDYEYDNCGTQSRKVCSSRGRIIKPKGHARTGQAY